MTKVKTYTFEQAKANVARVEKQAKTLQALIHATAVAFLKHWHDNPSAGAEVAEQINLLMAASPYHKKAFSVWVGASVDVFDKKTETMVSTRLCPMRWSEENKAWYVHADDKITGKEFIAARDNPFWKVSPAPEAKPFDDIEALEKMMETVYRKAKARKEGDVIHLGMWREIKAAVEKAKSAA